MKCSISLRTRRPIASLIAVASLLATAGFGLLGMWRSNAGPGISIASTSAVPNQRQADSRKTRHLHPRRLYS